MCYSEANIFLCLSPKRGLYLSKFFPGFLLVSLGNISTSGKKSLLVREFAV
jgi:hypothetical protein